MYYLVNCNAQQIKLNQPNIPFLEISGVDDLNLALNKLPESSPAVLVLWHASSYPPELVQHSRIDAVISVAATAENELGLGIIEVEEAALSGQFFNSLDRFFTQKRTENFFFKDRIKTLEAGMRDVVTVLEKETLNVKESYKKVRKLMVKDFKSVRAQNLYKIGLSSGSEICEFIQKDSKLLWVSFSTKTYESSAYLIREVENILRDKYPGYEGARDLFMSCGLRSSERNDQIQAMMMEIDLKTLEVRGNRFGNYYFLSTNKKNILFPTKIPFDDNFLDASNFKFSLQRGERILLISPGVLNNYEDIKPEDDLTKFCLNHLERGQDDILDEIFIELREKFKDSFFEYDSYLTYVEVPKNAILSIN